MSSSQIKAISHFQAASEKLIESVESLVALGIIDKKTREYLLRGHTLAEKEINFYICHQ